MISSQDSPVQVNYNNNTINGNVVQANNLIVKGYALYNVTLTGTVKSPTPQGLESYQFNINGETINVEIFESGLITHNEIINIFISIYSRLFKIIDKKYNTTLFLNLANSFSQQLSRVNDTFILIINVSINPFWDYATKNRYSNFQFARKMFTSFSSFDSVGQSAGSTLENITWRIGSSMPYDLSSPLLTLFNLSFNDLKNQYSNEATTPNYLNFDLTIALIWSGIFTGGGSGTITQAEFNALLGTSNLETLNDTYLKKKSFLTCNGSTTGRNRYIGRYCVLEPTANFVLNSGAVQIQETNFPVNTNKSTDRTFLIDDPSSNYKFQAGVYRVTMRIEYIIDSSVSLPVLFFQLSVSPTIQGLQTDESNCSINNPVPQTKAGQGDANTLVGTRVLSIATDSFLYLTAYTSLATCRFYGNQCQIVVERIADYS